ncbi:MAG: phage tail tape measure protein, partial [Gammaproteobacteria bacterium]|nr:phage tail tape measure protein [Gammaproteobacteria bacterium]
ETLKRTRDSLVLAKISGTDFADSAVAITAALNSFSNELITSTDLVDRLTNADANFAVSAGDLAEAIKRVGSSASEANISLNETIALVTAAQQITARGGAVIGNSFKTIFARLGRAAVLDDLDALGIKTKDASGNALPLIQVLKNLGSTYDSLSQRQQSFVAELVGGVYQINILRATLRDLSDGGSVFSQALSTLENSAGSAQARIDQLNQTLSAKLNVTLNRSIELAAAIGNKTIAPVFKGGLDIINSNLEDLKDAADGEGIGKKIVDGILGGIKGAIAGPGAFFAGFFATKLISNFGSFVKESVSSFAGLNSAAQQQSAIQNQIVQYLQRNPALLASIHSGTTSVAQAHQQILAVIRQENALLAFQNQQATTLAGMAYRSGVRVAPAPKNAAKGFIPNFNNIGVAQEKAEAKQAGYTAGSVYTRRIYDGNGGSFNSFVNSAEKITDFTNSNGKKATIVRPPNGFGRGTKVAAKGFVPNFVVMKIPTSVLDQFLTTEDAKRKDQEARESGSGITTDILKQSGRSRKGL